MRSSLGWKQLGADHITTLKRHKRIVFVFTHTSYLDFVPYVTYISDSEDLRRRAVAIVKPQLVNSYPILSLYGCVAATPRDVKGGGQVAQIAEALRKMDEFILFISPKGTSKKCDDWRTGFYHIARETDAQIIVGGFDYEEKTLKIVDTFDPHSFSCADAISRCKQKMQEVSTLNPENAEVEGRTKRRPSFICGTRLMALIVLLVLVIVIILLILRHLL